MNTETTSLHVAAVPAPVLPTVDAHIYPKGGLDVLSREEVARLRDVSSGMHDLLRRCALAVLTSGSASDDPRAAQELYPHFDIEVHQQDRGMRIELRGAPAMAFVDRRDHPRRRRIAVRRGARPGLHRDRTGAGTRRGAADHRRHHRCRVPPVAQCTRAAPDRSQPGGVLGRPFDRPRGIRLHQAGRLRAGPARAGHLHRLRAGCDEGADEGRHHCPCQAAPAPQPLHRHHRAGHHRGRVAEPDRQPPGDHAGHREAPGGLRAHGPRHHRVPRRRRHRRGNPVPAGHPAARGKRRVASSR